MNSDTEISLTLPGPQYPGSYTLRVESSELVGAVTFLDAESFKKQGGKRAVIVAGRVSASDQLWSKTQLCVKTAYEKLTSEGYTKDRINVLSPGSITDLSDINRTDALTSELKKVIEKLAGENTGELLLYMTGHGEAEKFYLNKEKNEVLSPKELDEWLDSFQEKTSARVIVIYDACYSGSFLPLLTSPEGKERIVITTTAADKMAAFEDGGRDSFSFWFWSYISTGDVFEAFRKAAENTKKFTSPQTAYIDADGDGLGYTPSDTGSSSAKAAFRTTTYDERLSGVYIGKKAEDIERPVIGSVGSGEKILQGKSSTTLRADITSKYSIAKVSASVTPPGSVKPEDQDKLELKDEDGDDTYEIVYYKFSRTGKYTVSFYALDEQGVCSLPKRITVERTDGLTLQKGDINGDGKTDLKDAVIALRVLKDGKTDLKDAVIALRVLKGDKDVSALILSECAKCKQEGITYEQSGVDAAGSVKLGLEDAVYILKKAAK